MADTAAQRRRIVVLISGSGTNLQALIDAQNTPALPNAHIVLPYLKAAPDRTRSTYDAEVARIVLDARPDIVVLAGWMHVLSEGFLDAMGSIPVINIHPALPGAFDGTGAIERSYEAFQKGEEVDRGEPVVVREVEIKKGEPLEAYEARLHRTEWEMIVEATQKVVGEVGLP
ncbi:formyl transferase [Russula vinacea]|nr:formyl transferase [Russula vinacea]